MSVFFPILVVNVIDRRSLPSRGAEEGRVHEIGGCVIDGVIAPTNLFIAVAPSGRVRTGRW